MATITIDVDDEVLKEIEAKAAKENRNLAGVVNELLRRDLAKPYKLELEGWKWKTKLRPGVDLTSREKLYDLMDDAEEMKRRGF